MRFSYDPRYNIAYIRFRQKSAEVQSVKISDELILAWYPRLLHASPEQRANWRIAGAGYGIYWPDIDEDLSTQGLLRGAPAPRAPRSAAASAGSDNEAGTTTKG